MTPSKESIVRARGWLESDRELCTWAPLLRDGKLTRHAWRVWRASVGGLQDGKTICGLDAEIPKGQAGVLYDSSCTPDCEACRDAAAHSLAALLDDVRRLPAVLAVAGGSAERAAAFCRRHRHMETSEALGALAAEFELVRRAALKDAAEWVENVGRHSPRDRASVAFEIVNVIRARAVEGGG